MSTKLRTVDRQAFTLLELVVVLFVGLIVLSMIVPSDWHRTKRRAAWTRCVSNLKSIGPGLSLSQSGNTNLFPIASPLASNNPAYVSEYFAVRAIELKTPNILICPTDKRRAAKSFAHLRNANISYFLGRDTVETMPQTFLAGDRNLTINGTQVPSGIVDLTTNTTLAWSSAMHGQAGNIALGDGSVQSTTTSYLQKRVREIGSATNRLIIP